MNYLAHGLELLDRPAALAGAALPDWLSVVDRRCRVRSKRALEFVDDPDPFVADFARGVARHHQDDALFHAGETFSRLSLDLTRQVRQATAPATDLRPGFLGHILVELLLDAALTAEAPARLERYYAALDGLAAPRVAAAAERLAGRAIPRLDEFIDAFRRTRFLWDYLDDARLCRRVNNVLDRVGLPRMESGLEPIVVAARPLVATAIADLLAGR